MNNMSQVELYPFESFLAEFGGALGLFTGFSFMFFAGDHKYKDKYKDKHKYRDKGKESRGALGIFVFFADLTDWVVKFLLKGLRGGSSILK